MYLPEEGRYSNLMKLPEGEDIGRKIRDAMRAIEAENEDLKGVLPQSEYNRLDNRSLFSLLKVFNLREEILDADDDLFGDIYHGKTYGLPSTRIANFTRVQHFISAPAPERALSLRKHRKKVA